MAANPTSIQPTTAASAVLPSGAFRRYDESPDADFYQLARLVTHIDDGAIAAVTKLYREHLPNGGAILDLMSSWISHLPNEAKYESVVGLGMNAQELAANPRLASFVVQDLNENPTLPFADAVFDGATCCVSVDYLTDPVAVIREVGRTLRPNAPFVVTFSNRCFPTKAVAIWHARDEAGRVALVADLFLRAGNFDRIETLDRTPANSKGQRTGDPLYAVIGRRRMNPTD